MSDAVCLTRGDRFYTTDYSPKFLTNWGFNEASYDLNLNSGCVFYKLFIRAFPNHFKRDSAYAHYPMCVPSETEKILTNLGRVKHFTFDRPAYHPPSVDISSSSAAKHVVANQDKYVENMQESLTTMLATISTTSSKPHTSKPHQLFKPEWSSAVKASYASIMASLLKEKSFDLAGAKFVDIVRDVGNVAPTRFIAELFGLPLQTETNTRGVYTDDELYMALATIYMSLSRDHDPVKSYPRREASAALAHQLGTLLEAGVKKSGGGLFGGSKSKSGTLSSHGASAIKALSQASVSNRDIAWSHLLPAIAATVPTIAEMFAQALDYYLTPEGTKHIFELQRVAGLEPTPESDALLLGYCLEGVRLAGGFVTSRTALLADVITREDGSQVSVHPGERVFINCASQDEAHFPAASTVNLSRPVESYIFLSAMSTSFADRGLVVAGVTEMFRGVFRLLKNVRRSPGPQGELKKVRQRGTSSGVDGAWVYLREDRGAYVPFPCTMRVCYDL